MESIPIDDYNSKSFWFIFGPIRLRNPVFFAIISESHKCEPPDIICHDSECHGIYPIVMALIMAKSAYSPDPSSDSS